MRMEMKSNFLYLAVLILGHLLLPGFSTVESPPYTVAHLGPDYEIRLYMESSWMSAPVQGTSFEKFTKQGFHRLYQYLHGTNLNSTQLPFTAPVLTSITAPIQGTLYLVKFYMSGKNTSPQPNQELDLELEKWRPQCVAVRKFSGFAKDDNINEEKEALVSSLNKQYSTGKNRLGNDDSFSVAQYNASHHLSGRLNEVWMPVQDFTADGCPTSSHGE
ncbi:hypothetical protein HS088_TW10G00080 [Tripterygium wilfordii]|uniref:Heme-binding protein 2-like n=1 Tax=Tripterygium wilfordii TaxID=458696 RepID=A0A7J7D408_TRIWF|nr:uncharacterized protein LOC120007602 [Tripterygium wilfordii]KAF5741085.1 hypothetical protein HS088_TW10G00080 [Tripterygium wilfordii]